MIARDFTHEHSLKVASDAAAVFVRGLVAAGYATRVLGRPQPGEFVIETIEAGFRVVVNPLPGRVAA